MLRVTNPANGQVIDEIAEHSFSEIREIVAKARAAQQEWSQQTIAARVECLQRFSALLLERQDDLATVLARETGKPRQQALNEIRGTPGRVDFFAETVQAFMEPRQVRDDGTTREILGWEPLGVIANISAWNYPYFVGSNVFVPALMAGNSVVYKPSEHCPRTGLKIAETLQEAGVPEGVFTAIIGGGNVGRAHRRFGAMGAHERSCRETGERRSWYRTSRIGIAAGGYTTAWVSILSLTVVSLRQPPVCPELALSRDGGVIALAVLGHV